MPAGSECTGITAAPLDVVMSVKQKEACMMKKQSGTWQVHPVTIGCHLGLQTFHQCLVPCLPDDRRQEELHDWLLHSWWTEAGGGGIRA